MAVMASHGFPEGMFDRRVSSIDCEGAPFAHTTSHVSMNR